MKLIDPRSLFTVFLVFMPFSLCFGQGLLDKRVSVDVKQKPVKSVLNTLETSCSCSFSYNSALIPVDSLVTISAKKQTVKHTLYAIFGERYQFKEIDNHIIITPAEKEKWFTITGNVTDAITGTSIAGASVFERHELASTLTDHNGNFSLRLKDKGRHPEASITISMGSFYRDTSLNITSGFDQELSIALTPTTYALPDVSITPGMEKSWLGKFLLSSKLRQQSANLGKFFVDKPVQASFIPGIGTHGKLSGQVTNKFSFNILGGYGAGVDGLEIGGLFNIDKKDVQYTQIGGIFNIVSGNVTGVQIGGIVNQVSGSVDGVQISGIAGLVEGNAKGVTVAGICNQEAGDVKGLQIAGIINLLTQSETGKGNSTDTTFGMKGVQAAGIANIVNNNSHGMQLAGILNISRKGMKGAQISGICNIASKMDGVQFGLINIADTVTGYSLGLINIVKKGYHTLAVSTNELMNANLSYRTGNKKLYSILEVGANVARDQKKYAYGIGVGTERKISKRTGVAGELTVLDLYAGNDNDPILIRTSILFKWHITRKLALFAGPTASFMPYITPGTQPEYQQRLSSSALYDFKTGHNTATWIGWQAGFHFF